MLYLLCLRKAEQIVLGHPVSGKPTAETPQFVFMDEVLGQSHSLVILAVCFGSLSCWKTHFSML